MMIYPMVKPHTDRIITKKMPDDSQNLDQDQELFFAELFQVIHASAQQDAVERCRAAVAA